ncbi:hypothetical protein [Litoribrevibacter albus]|uniref:DUF2269 family protein n=1 Tax=Litoribrevibacter albus TaxID=1473156 RepID=A0AA37S839_9GAMM|nr:hypothetical protein [Litoribrevibacter albus]GLQ29989.1 hypothetical protein GCM10007876_04670 [Litoribrevibacter albus]
MLKLVHLGALVFWLGPPFGAWLVLKFVAPLSTYTDPVAAKVSRVFYWTIILEHIAFAVLLITGFTLALKYGLMGAQWLDQKLLIVFLLVIPLEIIDVCLGNWIAARASKKLYGGQTVTSWERKGLEIYHGLFTKVALAIIPLAVLGIMYLAISKSTLDTLF